MNITRVTDDLISTLHRFLTERRKTIARPLLLKAEVENQEARRHEEIKRRNKAKSDGRVPRRWPFSKRKIQAEITEDDVVFEPTVGVIVITWTRRVTYLVLLPFCAVYTYLVLFLPTLNVFGVFLGGSNPSNVTDFLSSYFLLLSGIYVVSVVALASMLIEEFSARLPAVAKIAPGLSTVARICYRALAIIMFGLAMVFIAILVLVKIEYATTGSFTVGFIFALLVALAVLAVVSTVLAIFGALAGAGSLIVIVVNGVLALFVLLGLACLSLWRRTLSALDTRRSRHRRPNASDPE